MATPDNLSTRALRCEIVESSTTISFGQLCRSCGMGADWVMLLVDEGVLEPVRPLETPAGAQRRWHFPASHLARARTAARLHRDLSINVAGLGLALDLLEEIEQLRAQLDAAQERHHLLD